jgi:hypothetical protein
LEWLELEGRLESEGDDAPKGAERADRAARRRRWFGARQGEGKLGRWHGRREQEEKPDREVGARGRRCTGRARTRPRVGRAERGRRAVRRGKK